MSQPVIQIHPEQSEREQLHILFPRLNMSSRIGFYHMYKQYTKNADSNIDELIESIPEKRIHTALTQVRNELICQMEENDD